MLGIFRFLILFLLFSYSYVLAMSDTRISVSVQFSSESFRAVEPFVVKIQSKSREKIQYKSYIPFVSDDFIILGIENVVLKYSQKERQWISEIYFNFLPLSDVVIDFPSIEIEYTLHDGTIIVSSTPEKEITIYNDILKNSQLEVRGVKSPMDIIEKIPYIYYIVGIIIVLLLMIYGFFLYRKRSRLKKLSQVKDVPLAQFNLKILTNDYDKGVVSASFVYFKLSTILKTFLFQEYSIDSLKNTTLEICVLLKNKNQFGSTFIHELKTILTRYDLIVFANLNPHREDIMKDIERLRKFICFYGGARIFL